MDRHAFLSSRLVSSHWQDLNTPRRSKFRTEFRNSVGGLEGGNQRVGEKGFECGLTRVGDGMRETDPRLTGMEEGSARG